jgi:predicted O-methyltransferase YrrM
MQTCEDVRAIAATIDGWLADVQGCALFEAASATAGRGAIVEIGSWKGRSTTWLAAGARLAGRRVYAVDPHTGSTEDPAANTLDEFCANLERAGLAGVVEPLVMTSAQAARRLDGPIELLFIDGDHSYEGAKHDADLWLPRLVEGGTAMCHDVATSGYSGPRRVFRRAICWNGGFDRIRRVGSMLTARRIRRRDLRAAVWGTAAGLLLYVYDVQRLVRAVSHRWIPASVRQRVRPRRVPQTRGS